jgi:hypothetical protein
MFGSGESGKRRFQLRYFGAAQELAMAEHTTDRIV